MMCGPQAHVYKVAKKIVLLLLGNKSGHPTIPTHLILLPLHVTTQSESLTSICSTASQTIIWSKEKLIYLPKDKKRKKSFFQCLQKDFLFHSYELEQWMICRKTLQFPSFHLLPLYMFTSIMPNSLPVRLLFVASAWFYPCTHHTNLHENSRG